MLEDGSDVQEYAYGSRNPFDIDFNANDDMFTADNSANVKPDENPPDELHYVRPGGDHGFPDVLGDPPEDSDVEKPLKTWLPSLAPGGLEFYDGGTLTALSENEMLLAKWNFLEIARVRIELVDGEYQYIEDENIVQGFGTPVTDMTVAPNGDIYIADWGGGRIFRISP
jgi:glucose/arabinose dehydrogenase